MMIDSKIKRKLKSLASLSLLVGAVSFSSCSGGSDQKSGISKTNPEDIKVVSEMVAELTAPPFGPKSTADRAATKIIVDMEIIDKTGTMASGVEYVYGSVVG